MIKNKVTLIVAGGKGERMNAEIPKQFIEINGKPILMHTINVFHQYDSTMELILVLPKGDINFWIDLCKKHAFSTPHRIIAGGQTRFHSVKNGLETIKTPSVVAIHDGVRPLISLETILRCFGEAEQNSTAIPVIDMIDSIREITEKGNQYVDRNRFKLVQTPQVFDGELIKRAYEQEYLEKFTDDASVVEALGTKINMVEGNRENIKITTSYDLLLAQILLKI